MIQIKKSKWIYTFYLLISLWCFLMSVWMIICTYQDMTPFHRIIFIWAIIILPFLSYWLYRKIKDNKTILELSERGLFIVKNNELVDWLSVNDVYIVEGFGNMVRLIYGRHGYRADIDLNNVFSLDPEELVEIVKINSHLHSINEGNRFVDSVTISTRRKSLRTFYYGNKGLLRAQVCLLGGLLLIGPWIIYRPVLLMCALFWFVWTWETTITALFKGWFPDPEDPKGYISISHNAFGYVVFVSFSTMCSLVSLRMLWFAIGLYY